MGVASASNRAIARGRRRWRSVARGHNRTGSGINMTFRVCDSGEGANVCEACKQAQQEADALYELITGYISEKSLNDAQQVKTIIVAALSAVESFSVGRTLAASYIVAQVVSNWVYLIGESQSVDLETSDD